MKNVFKIFTVVLMATFIYTKSNAQVRVGISVGFAPPEMPVYVQPECPEDGYMWQPGYWAYDDNDGYYWVPGVWVEAPEPGYLWTPPYWGYIGGSYGFHRGYWGHEVGFYGGINYGGGYGGFGFGGGMWSGNHFRYNTAVVNVNRTVIHNTYVNRTVINNQNTHSRTSFNGGNGTSARPRPQEVKAMNERHLQPTAQQVSHQQLASKDRNQFSTVNHGRPTATAVNKVGGRPFNPQGKVVSGTAFGKGTNPAKSNTPANTFRPSQEQKPGQQQHQAQPQQRPAQQQQQRPAQQQQQRPAQQQQQRPAQQQQQQRPAQQQQQQRPAQQQQQQRPAQQQQQQRPAQQQQQRPAQQQQQQRPQQQQHNNPRPGHDH